MAIWPRGGHSAPDDLLAGIFNAPAHTQAACDAFGAASC